MARPYVRVVAAVIALALFGCSPVPSGGGPKPKAIYLLPASAATPDELVKVLSADALGLDGVIDRSKETSSVGGTERPKFPQYQVAYWFPKAGSSVFGVALVQFVGNSELSSRYHIDVYSEDDHCALCSLTETAFAEAGLPVDSVCSSESEEHTLERRRCDTRRYATVSARPHGLP